MNVRITLFFVCLLSMCSILRAQSLDDAKNLYKEKRFAEALPVFRAEYEAKPDNAPLNLWLGVCLYETGNFLEAEKYLSFASQKNQVDACLYLADLYIKSYRLTNAEAEFAKYEKAKRRDKAALAELEKRRESLEKMNSLIRKVEDVQIIDSVVVNKNRFLSAYKLSASSGSLMPMNEFFENQPENENVMFLNERKDKVFFVQGDSQTGLDLFTMEKLLDSFGNEKRLPSSVNSSGNEAYPFVMPDGVTLYFASTQNGSIGGYDLFVTRYNINSNSYLTPSWLNMPFNSIYNDYMMAVDEERGIGWFASDRFQPEGSVCVYTFIPSEKVTLLENDDEQYLADRARITSIKDSWRAGIDYSPLLAESTTSTIGTTKSKGDFTFVINDKNTYRFLNDFKNKQARNAFAQAIDKEKKLLALQKELADKRQQFADSKGGNATLNSSILQLEQQTESLTKEVEQLKIQARNEEVRNIYQ